MSGVVVALAFIAAVVSAPGSTRGDARSGSIERARVVIGGETFVLEVVRGAAGQGRGLGLRASIGHREGMLFDFEAAETQMFVMRDCSVALDLVFVDEGMRIASVHSMLPEPPRGVGEERGDLAGEAAYAARLLGYMSAGPVRCAIELRAGVIGELGLKRGQMVIVRGEETEDAME